MNDFAFVAVLLAVRAFTFVASHDLAFQFKHSSLSFNSFRQRKSAQCVTLLVSHTQF